MADSSERRTPLPVGGYDYEFVNPPPESLQCPICLLPFRDPVLLSCCGHNGCNSCIARIKVTGHPCPICRQPFQSMLDKKLQRTVFGLDVFCSRNGEGCPWEGELRDLETHLRRDCGYVEEACRYKCGRRYQRRLLRDHEINMCPQRLQEVVTLRLMRKMAERMEKLETNLVAVAKAHHDDQMKLNLKIHDLLKQNASLQNENEKLSRKVAEFGAHAGPMWLMDSKGTPSSPYPPFTTVMTHFSKHKIDADHWYSRPFYSAPGGYKLSLRIDANGFGSGAGTHVSVLVFLMKGDNDCQLRWPFKHSVTYRILNWRRDVDHKIHTVPFKEGGAQEQARVTSGERAPLGLGGKALSHALLLDCANKETVYLHQDCLCLQVLKVEPPK